MSRTSAAKSSVKSHWLALLSGIAFAAMTAASCSVDKSQYTFIADDEFADASAMSGSANGGSKNGGGENGGGLNGAGDDGMSGGAGGSAGSSGDCTPGEHACSPDGHLQTCQAGDPPAFDAGLACGEGKCSARIATCLKCVPGDFQCANNLLQQCNIFGSAYEDSAVCDSKAACSAAGQKGFCVHCKPGTSSCEASLVHVLGAVSDSAEYLSTDLETCNLDGSGTDTAQVCVAESSLCDPVAKKCSSCVPGTYSCEGSSLNVCSADGSGYNYKQSCQAPNGACNATTGKCEPAACNNGSYQCQENVLQVCNNGAYTRLDVCESKDLCDANNGRCQKCVPNANSCVNGNVQTCDYNWGEATPYTVVTCLNGSCFSSGTTANCSCKPGTSICYDGSTGYTTCDAAGVSTYVQCPKDANTGTQQVCSSKYGKCGACVPGRFQCDENGALKQCADDGSDWKVVSDCRAAGKQCDAGRGECSFAQPGRFYCDDKGNLYSIGYDDKGTHEPVSKLVDQCGSPNQCNSYDGLCRSKRCVIGQLTCSGADVYSCDTGERRTRTSTRCSSASRCQDGFGCVKALAIAAGDAHTCVVVAGADALEGDPGYVMCWGANESGQLGDGSALFADSKQARPVLIGAGPGDGGGSNVTPRLSNFFTQVSAGKNFTCAEISIPDANGQSRVACWGSNEKGQLGADYADPSPHNGPFTGVTDSASNDKGIDLHGVTCGSEFACALGSDGTPWCWGANESGQLGNGSKDNAIAATPITGSAFAQLSAGARHVCGIKSDGTVWCWGDGSQGQLGNATQKSSSVPLLVGKVTAAPDRPMALGNDFSLVLGAKGSKNPSAWGANSFGQLGNASTNDAGAPSALLGLLSADFLAGGALFSGSTAEHACARLGDRLFCWGANVFGEVGDGSTIDRSNPVQIFDARSDLSKLAASTHAVAVGGRHSCAITAKGDVLCWGANHRQQLGNAAITPQRVPLRSF